MTATHLQRLAQYADEPRLITDAGFARILARLGSPNEGIGRRSILSVQQHEAVIRIIGPLTRGKVLDQLAVEGTAYEDIVSALSEAGGEPEVKRVTVEVDSPGGMATGLPIVAAAIARFEGEYSKPIVSHIVGVAGSAAYWLAASAPEVIADDGASVGSVGAYAAFADVREMLGRLGVRIDVVSSSPTKAAGLPGTSLTEEQRAYLQSRIDEISDEFKDHIRRHRSGVPDEALDGRVFSAQTALGMRLVDRVTDDWAGYETPRLHILSSSPLTARPQLDPNAPEPSETEDGWEAFCFPCGKEIHNSNQESER